MEGQIVGQCVSEGSYIDSNAYLIPDVLMRVVELFTIYRRHLGGEDVVR